jgi:hypothetical protein
MTCFGCDLPGLAFEEFGCCVLSKYKNIYLVFYLILGASIDNPGPSNVNFNVVIYHLTLTNNHVS